MDKLVINLDVDNKRGNFTQVKAIGAYEDVLVRIYNFPSAPDLPTLQSKLYLDDGTVISTCGTFVPNLTTPTIYEATLDLGTDLAIAYFSAQRPYFSQDLTLVVADTNQLYCNSKLTVKNNPNEVPVNPTPVTTHFVLEAPKDGQSYVRKDGTWVAYPDEADLVQKSDEGFTADLQGAGEQLDLNDAMTAGQVRRGLITLAKYLKAKGVI